jgi:lipoprotein-releasing system permease protein
MTLIGSFFVGASLVILVVVMSIMDGFQFRLRETYSGSSADLKVTPLYPADLEVLEREVLRAVPQAKAGGPYYETISLVRREGRVMQNEQEFHFAFVYGVDGVKEGRINRWVDNLTSKPRKGSKPKLTVADASRPFYVADELERAVGTKGVIVGATLQRTVGVRVGDKVKLLSVAAKGGARNGSGSGGDPDADDYELLQRLFLVVGVFETGNSEIDDRCVYMEHGDFAEFFPKAASRPSVRFKLGSPDDYEASKEHLKNNLERIVTASRLPDANVRAGLSVSTWKDKHKTLVRAIESEKQMILVIAFLIVVAGASSIFAAQWLLVTDKVREIGIFRALGASVGGVTSIFVINGLLMGVLGSVGGSLVGLLVVERIDTVHGWISMLLGHQVFNPDVYLFEKIPTRVDYEQVTQYAVAALVCTLIASAVPALRAGLMDPAKALRGD